MFRRAVRTPAGDASRRGDDAATSDGASVNRPGHELGRPTDYAGARAPRRAVLEGRLARLEPLDPMRHGDDLWQAAREAEARDSFDYLPYGPFKDRAGRSDRTARGVAAFANIVADMGVIEIGHVWFAPSLQRTAAASEAIFLLMAEAFDGLGYRRLEWKTNALNRPSRRAAERFGFTHEGVFRQHRVWKGRNRDTAWYALIDADWPLVRESFALWLGPANFDARGCQRRSLGEVRRSQCG
jgi:RimJ/RimL family protein N-acetyltransferase